MNQAWATDKRMVGYTLRSPFTHEQYEKALAKIRAVLDREGGTKNATIRIEVREDNPELVDIIATWSGFVAPDAESIRIWKDADAAFGREDIIIDRLTEVAEDPSVDKVSRARIGEVITWLRIP